jgi:preprotein translocase subunit Sss1
MTDKQKFILARIGVVVGTIMTLVGFIGMVINVLNQI